MNIQETVSIENPVETTEATTNNGDIQEHLDMPVARANAVAFILLQRIYSTDDETTQDERGSLIEFIDAFVHQKSFSGSADDFHNFAVELARRDEFALACDILDAGMKPGYFGKNCDLLADYLQYGVNCGRLKEAKRVFKIMLGIPRRKWTWRSFSFGVSFLQHLDQQDEIDKAIKVALTSIDCSHVDYPGLTDEQKCMLALVDEFKRFHPEKEEPYQVESQLYSYFKDDEKALAALQKAEETIPNCPKCSLKRADMLFERGAYSEACESVQRALEGSIQTQSSVNEGYLHYLYALCYVANTRKNNLQLTEEIVDTIYSHFESALEEFGDSRQNYREIIKRNARDIRSSSHIVIGDNYINLQALVNE